MNKTICLFLVIVCIVTACRHKNNYLNLVENDWKKGMLKGRVKKIVRNSFNRDGTGSQSVTEYNERGFVVLQVDSTMVTGKAMVATLVYRYDTVNNITFVSMFLNGVQQKLEQFEYDPAGNLVEVHRSLTKTTYTYDNKNRVLEELNYQNGALLNKTRYEYLANGSKKATFIEESSGVIRTEGIENDTMKTNKIWDQGGDLRKIWLYKKDKAGNIIYSEERNADSTLEGYSRMYYDEYNNMVTSIGFNVKNNTFDTLAMKYAYDKFGNYISVDSTWKREITYW